MSLVSDELDGGDTATSDEENVKEKVKVKTIREAVERLQSCRAIIDRTLKQYESDTGEKRSSLNVKFDKLSTFQTNLSKCQASPILIILIYSLQYHLIIVRNLGPLC